MDITTPIATSLRSTLIDDGPDALYTGAMLDQLRREVGDLESAIAGLVDRVSVTLVAETPQPTMLAEGTVQLPHNGLTSELVGISNDLVRMRYWVDAIAGRVAL